MPKKVKWPTSSLSSPNPDMVQVPNHIYFIFGIVFIGMAIIFMYMTRTTATPSFIIPSPSTPVTDLYHPPEKKSPWLDNALRYKRLLYPTNTPTAINIHTRAPLENYQQVGILTGVDLAGVPTVSPLMGRRSPSGNSYWQYYTIFNGSGSIIPVKLPVSVSGKTCSDERGCSELQTGDTVSAEGYGTNFLVTVYSNEPAYYI